MKRRAKLLLDMKRRQAFKRHELDLLHYYLLKNNRIVPTPTLSFSSSSSSSSTMLKPSIVKIRNRCVYTGRGRGVLKEWCMSRVVFRDLADQGLIPGVRRASW